MIRLAQVIFFCLLLMFLGFCAGMYLGSFFVPGGSGLAGPPVALGYGLAGLVTGLITGVVLARIMRHSWLRNILIIACILSLIMCGWIIYRIKLIKHQQTRTEKSNFFLHTAVFYETSVRLPLGAGIAKPYLIPGKRFISTPMFLSVLPLIN